MGHPPIEEHPDLAGPAHGEAARLELAADSFDATAQPFRPSPVGDDLLAAKATLKARMGGFDAPRFESTGADTAVVGWGVGLKRTAGTDTAQLAVKVYVSAKRPLHELSPAQRIPAIIDGIPTDVVEVGEIVALGYTGTYRPVPGGSSVGHFRVTAGTHGGLVQLENGKLCLLSNNHVLANVNEAASGDPILRPGSADGGRLPTDRIATLEGWTPIDFAAPNATDAAVAWTSFAVASPGFHELGTIGTDPLPPAIGLPVRKVGRTTGHTVGRIVGMHADVRVVYGARTAIFTEQIQIRTLDGSPFSQGGDSGALIVTADTRRPVGLLFAGGGADTFANPIGPVMAALGIRRFLARPE